MELKCNQCSSPRCAPPHFVPLTCIVLLLCGYMTEGQYMATIAGAGGGDSGPAGRAALNRACRFAFDSTHGNLYIADANSHLVRKVQNGTISIVAGVGYSGYSGNDELAVLAELSYPFDVTYDSYLNSLWIADTSNHVIRRVLVNGTIVLVAGRGGYPGLVDGSDPSKTRLNSPYGIEYDPSTRSVLIADTMNHAIRRLFSNGTMQTLAGDGLASFFGFDAPLSVQLDAGSKSIFVADSQSNRIRRLFLNGTIVTAAGSGTQGFSGDNGPATSASLNFPADVHYDAASGMMYIADPLNYRIRVVSPSGIISTFAGSVSSANWNGDGGYPALSTIDSPYGVYFDNATKSLYFSDYDNRIRRTTAAGPVETVVGFGRNGLLQTLTGDGGPATQARLVVPGAVWLDGTTLYISEINGHRVRRVFANGTIQLVAGTGYGGYTGDNIPASQASLYAPNGVYYNSSCGCLYIADSSNHRVRRVLPNGTIQTYAGDGTAGYGADGIAATLSSLYQPVALAYSPFKNILCISEKSSFRIRCVASNGTITTVAGVAGYTTYNGDGIPATSSRLQSPNGILFHPVSGILYIADQLHHRIRAVFPNGTITTVAGTGSGGYNGDGGVATLAQLQEPTNLAFDPFTGTLYISDSVNHRIRALYSNGSMDTVAGAGSTCPQCDGQTATRTQLFTPYSVSFDATNNALYVVEQAAGRVRTFNVTTGSNSIVAGGWIVTMPGDGHDAFVANLLLPTAVSISATTGILYIADRNEHVVRQIFPNGTIIRTAGTGTMGYNGDNIEATEAMLNSPDAVLFDDRPPTSLYISDASSHRIRKVSSNGTIVTVAGTGISGFSETGAAATLTTINLPRGLALDPTNGTLYFSDSSNCRVRALLPNATIHTVVGNGTCRFSAVTSLATLTCIAAPNGLAYDADTGSLYIAEPSGNAIRMLDNFGYLQLVAGTGTSGYSGSGGPATSAQLSAPSCVALHAAARCLYIADSGNHCIRRVCGDGVIITVAGVAMAPEFYGDWGCATCINLWDPRGLAVAEDTGLVYIADAHNNRIRQYVPPSPTPSATPSVPPAPSLSSTFTPTPTRTSTPSATPFISVVSAYTSLVALPTCDADGSCVTESEIGVLQIEGQSLRAACALNATGWPVNITQFWTNATLTRLIQCNATVIIAEFLYQEDLSTWLWNSRPLQLQVPYIGVTPAVPVQPIVGIVPIANVSVAYWGDTIRITAFGLGACNPSGVTFMSTALAAPPLPCSNVRTEGPHSIVCDVRYTSNMWAYSSVRIEFTYGSNTFNVVTQGLITLQPPAAPFIEKPALAFRNGTSTLTVVMNQPPWSASKCAQAGLPFQCELVVGETTSAVPCNYLSTQGQSIMSVFVPGLHGVNLPVTLRIASLLQFSVGSLNYEPGGIAHMLPATTLVPARATHKQLVLTLQLATPDDASYMSAIRVNGAGCTITQVTGGLSCKVDVATLWSLLPSSPDEASVEVSYHWLNASEWFVSRMVGRLIMRPTVQSVSPNTAVAASPLIIFGANFCPAGDCAHAAMVVLVGTHTCTSAVAITDSVLTCLAPLISSADAAYPTFPVSVTNSVGMNASKVVYVTYPTDARVAPMLDLPTTFVPSDSYSPWPLPADIAVQVVNADGTIVLFGMLDCSILTTSPGVLVFPVSPTQTSHARGVNTINFGRIGIQAAFSLETVSLFVSCTVDNATDVTTASPLTFDVRMVPLQVHMCDDMVSEIQSQVALPSWSLVVINTDTAPSDPRQVCSHFPLQADIPLPPIVCTATAAADGKAAPVLQGNSANVELTFGWAIFESMVVGGATETVFTVTIRCNIGAVTIPPVLTRNLTISGCAPGAQSSGAICVPCPGDQYSDGGSQPCRGCPPHGARCIDGVLQLLPGFYRPPRDTYALFNEASEIVECSVLGSCLVNDTSRIYSCAPGYTGVLCGVCDEDNDYARVGMVCSPCMSSATNNILLSLLIVLLVLLLGAFAIRKSSKRSASSIALRMILTHVQASGSLRAFKSSGTTLYHACMTWTDALTPALFSQGPGQCAAHPSFATSFAITLAAPLITSSSAVIMLYLLRIYTAFKAPKPVLSSESEVKTLQDAPSVRVSVCGRCARLARPPSAQSHVAPVTGMQALRMESLGSRKSLQKPFFILLFMCQLAYMPIVSACLNVFDCSDPIAGVRYMTTDLRVACGESAHMGISVAAGVVLFLYGLGFPTLLFIKLYRASILELDDPDFHGTWGFLYDGYRTKLLRGMVEGTQHSLISRLLSPKHSLVWWETTVLLRKAGIVMLARLVPNAMLQISAFLLWIGLFVSIHLKFHPYESPEFHFTEGLSLFCIEITAALSIVTHNSDPTSSTSVGITVLMLLLNFATMAWLIRSFVRSFYHIHRHAISARSAQLFGRFRKSSKAHPKTKENTANESMNPLKSIGGVTKSISPTQDKTKTRPSVLASMPLFVSAEPEARPARTTENTHQKTPFAPKPINKVGSSITRMLSNPLRTISLRKEAKIRATVWTAFPAPGDKTDVEAW